MPEVYSCLLCTCAHMRVHCTGCNAVCDPCIWLVQDAYLPQRLVDKLMYMYNYIEMARVTGVPMSFLLTRGQSIKVFSQILRKARQRNLLIPFVKVHSRQILLLCNCEMCLRGLSIGIGCSHWCKKDSTSTATKAQALQTFSPKVRRSFSGCSTSLRSPQCSYVT